ncbi:MULTISPECIES: hypothetical protein [unclassified Pseudomonas]|uniref:hypothetical protein n=1 Tax=unclassified Pseudomonas TaxID=196821 RepID=UPI000BDDD6F9|nr:MULTISPECIES: hypothetical protein [unclassified Pseudomonas]PVZ19913.1 hypothetical protein F474_00504 [Pseudomonas sp. URIL14HWK12:I12]PVZ26979.1 hypothetical protein F470_00159 [Pseudomonas sp. URIL14HWK12:I10]PVZ37868.1 hypothetical protein F472_00504 [Pseudomonas sp. URIL14HWK12:I11]SNZ05346.1 hypothetical protein SAMN05660463_00900 [Pseudomonas sp. URIL14HWK12:I9]
MARLLVKTEDDETIIDTDYINYGLIASGNLVYRETWYGKTKPYINSDPNLESSWQSTTYYADAIYEFSAEKCIAPIIYVVGQAFLEGTERSGSRFTWLFSGAGSGVKIFVFDQMREAGTGPALIFRNTDNVVTFNSRQAPLNVRGSVTAPGVPGLAPEGHPRGALAAYIGGSTMVTWESPIFHAITWIDMPTGLTGEVAANIAFTRAAQVWGGTDVDPRNAHSVSEFAYGNGNNVRFAFRSVAGAYVNNQVASNVVYTQFSNVPGILPAATFISTAGLQFPFQI